MPTGNYRLLVTVIAIVTSVTASADDPKPPAGFRAIFNGDDLDGWHGLNPHQSAKLKGEKKRENLEAQRAEFSKHWSVENGEFVNDGHGPYATTDEDFGDMEFLIEYKTVAKADSGIYLRGTPQVQIWDSSQVFDPKRPTRKPHLGSGGLFNNTPGASGRDPMVKADRPFGEWNQFRIRQIGGRTWVWLNQHLVVDGAVMENFWDRQKPLADKGPIMLQTHGGEIRWRNLFVRDIKPDEAQQTVGAADEPPASLMNALSLHASFDNGLDADFSRGDRTCYIRKGKTLLHAAATDDVQLSADGGRFGSGLHFRKKNSFRPAFENSGVLGYNGDSWNTTVCVWLRLNPDKDLEPGYCDPVQIVGDDGKKGFIFLEWSKDERPRYFRYAVRPLFDIWNPNNVSWADIPFDKRPMVQVERAPFSREAWTHVVFTLENVNDKSKPSAGRLYLNGKLQGAIENWNLTLGWDPSQVLLVLGASYVGHMDDLAVFNRVLSDAEVQQIYALKNGVRNLYSFAAAK
ncbi:MAG: family 16 glycoside hydrolase [Fuerstiella sp.]